MDGNLDSLNNLQCSECSVCSDTLRSEIELKVLEGVSLEQIVGEYDVTLVDLTTHVLFHSDMGRITNTEDSLVKKLKLKEAEVLRTVYQNYLVTLTNLGFYINTKINSMGPNDTVDKIVGRSTVDLYLGTGGQVRDTVRLLMDMDKNVNGEGDSGFDVIRDLIGAVRRSSPTTLSQSTEPIGPVESATEGEGNS